MENWIWFVLMEIIIAVAVIAFLRGSRGKAERPTTYAVRFTCGNRVHKHILNEEQYQQLLVWINGTDGYYRLESDTDVVVLYREHTAAVEVHKR